MRTAEAEESALAALSESFGAPRSQTIQAVTYAAEDVAPSELFDNPFSDDGPASPKVDVEPRPMPFSADAPTMAPPLDSSSPVDCCDAGAATCDTCPKCQSCQGDGHPARPGSGLRGTCLSQLCACNLGDAWSLSELLHGDCPPAITIGGWLSAGYHSKSNDLFNDRPEKFALHQGWLHAEKLAESCSSPFGFRLDVMYGIDAADTQAFGNPSGSWDFENGFDHGAYGWAIPQAYGEVAFGDWNVKAGHFFTLAGYEVVPAPDNFFYSHAMTMYNSEPFTHTGVVATHSRDGIETFFGWTLGWDTGFDQLNGGNSWLGGASLDLGDNVRLTYITTAGNLGGRGNDAVSSSVVFDTSLTDKLNWVLQSDSLRVNSTGEDNVGINNYLFYSAHDCLGLGVRMEWWKGDVLTGYAPHGAVLPASGSLSYYAATFGVNYRPHANLVLRPEARMDWSPAANYDTTYFGIDAIFTF